MTVMATIKKRIDKMEYPEMLRLWRNATTGTVLFQGKNGLYFKKVMDEKRKTITSSEHTNISKQIGWYRG